MGWLLVSGGPRGSERLMNQDALTVIEADGLFSDLSTGLYGWEEVNLSVCFVYYAIEHGAKDSDFDSIRSEARKKYPTTKERAKIVVRALDILLEQSRLMGANKQIVTKTKARLRAEPR